MNKPIAGFSKLSKEEKIRWIAKEYFSNQEKRPDKLKYDCKRSLDDGFSQRGKMLQAQKRIVDS